MNLTQSESDESIMLEQERQQRRKEDEAMEKVKEVEARIQVTVIAEQNKGCEPAHPATRDGEDSDLKM